VDEIKRLFAEKGCHPIFIPKTMMQRYQLYLQTILYPIFHSFKGLDDQKYANL
jgi:hypothetical protein